MAIAKQIALWLITLLLAFVFLAHGLNKFPADGGWAHAFAQWHFPVWFRILIGVIEIAAALLILWPRTASIGAAMIVVVMLGGMATHIWWGHPDQTFHEAVPLVLAIIVGIARRARLLRLAAAAALMLAPLAFGAGL